MSYYAPETEPPDEPRDETGDRHHANTSTLEALLAISEAVTFVLLAEHTDLLLRLPDRDLPPPRDLDQEARRLLDLLGSIHDAVHRYTLLTATDDDIPF